MSNLKVYGEADQKTLDQVERCLITEGSRAVLCADNHLGYSQPIGAAVAYPEHISPTGVGYDIGCGNKAVRTDAFVEDVNIEKVMDDIVAQISFGVGRSNKEPVDHEVLDKIRSSPLKFQRDMLDTAAAQLGTVGAGNHYVDLFEGEDGVLWIGVHFGSRGFGWKTADTFMKMGDDYQDGYDAPPVLFQQDSGAGQDYLLGMELAGAYAYAGRDMVVDKVLGILGAHQNAEVHNHHNFAWQEEHDGQEYWVVRKGCTPAWPGQAGFVGSTMGEPSVILVGQESAKDALYSTVHGAGRAMSRTEAAGKTKKRWTCNNRECDWFQQPGEHKPDNGCPKCGTANLSKRWVQMSQGRVDWDETLSKMKLMDIELRGGAADEAPPAYKRLNEVLAAHGDSVRILETLIPVGVAMAGQHTFDPYKD